MEVLLHHQIYNPIRFQYANTSCATLIYQEKGGGPCRTGCFLIESIFLNETKSVDASELILGDFNHTTVYIIVTYVLSDFTKKSTKQITSLLTSSKKNSNTSVS